jgi:NitT/TauT family transport system substrate-binding protein
VRLVIRRRTFLGAMGAALATACAPSASTGKTAAPSVGPLETTTIRIALTPPCDPWYWLSEPFLREEGFTDIQYGATGGPGEGTAEFGVIYGNGLVAAVDAGAPVIAVAGAHTGCIELWARPGINTIADLRGKRIAINTKTLTVAGNTATDLFYGFFVSLLAYVGMQPGDANFIEIGADKSVNAYFVDGKADAILTAGAAGPVLHGTKDNPGRVILDTAADKPWSQNYCCLLVTNREWARANPVAVRRATRAILRSVDAGKRDLRATAKVAIERGAYNGTPAITEQVVYDVIKDQSFDWRDYDPEETVRFFALRLGDAKLIKKTPAQIIADGTDFAYFRRLRTELTP